MRDRTTTQKIKPATLILAAFLCAGAYYLHSRAPQQVFLAPEIASMLDEFRPHLKPGDIIFRKENSFWGEVSSSVARRDGRYSHVGMIVPSGENLAVVHSYPDENTSFVKSQSLEEFSFNATGLGFFRMGFSEEKTNNIVTAIQGYARDEVPFDPEFSLRSDDRLYCTELIWKAVKNATGVDIAPEKGQAFGDEFIGNDDLFLGGFMEEIAPPASLTVSK